ncbi:MAG: aldo/keto reductase [Gammaproteobacteria bacterium]|nr:aldo/keto reductase [Gammaproteobacteria bacterium]
MKYISIGTTDIQVSLAGLGTAKFGRNQKMHYPSSFELPADNAITDLLGYAKDVGINLLDTAPAYGLSEERLGKLLKKQRYEWIISSKAGEEFINGESQYDFSPLAIRNSVERSLKRLRTDFIDILFIHSNGEDKKIILENGALDTLKELKKAGLIRAYGMSTKTIEGGLLAIDRDVDTVMITFNPVNHEEKPVIDYAYQKNVGIFIKKAFASGHLQKIEGTDPIQTAIDFILKEKGITSIILGTLNRNHLEYNVQCIKQHI